MDGLIDKVAPSINALKEGDYLVVVDDDLVTGFNLGSIHEVHRDTRMKYEIEQLYIKHDHGTFHLYRNLRRNGTDKVYGFAKIAMSN